MHNCIIQILNFVIMLLQLFRTYAFLISNPAHAALWLSPDQRNIPHRNKMAGKCLYLSEIPAVLKTFYTILRLKIKTKILCRVWNWKKKYKKSKKKWLLIKFEICEMFIYLQSHYIGCYVCFFRLWLIINLEDKQKFKALWHR